MTAVGVASTRAHGQKTTRIVTARISSPVTSHVTQAMESAAATIQVAHRSASRTIFARLASADSTSFAMRAIVEASPTASARSSKTPKRLMEPDITWSPAVLSTGIGSPVSTDSSTDVLPERISPSTGTVSPGLTRMVSPFFTSEAGMMRSVPDVTTRAVSGASDARRSMPFRALATVISSRSAPSCMMTAISPAAKYSPMMIDAMRASETKRSALTSKRVMRPIAASMTIGVPQSRIATQERSMPETVTSKKPKRSAMAETTIRTIWRRVSSCQAARMKESGDIFYIYPYGY